MSASDDIIKQKADGHEAPVPPGAWENIMPQKKKRRFVFWLWMLAGLIIAGVGIPAYFYSGNDERIQQPVGVASTSQTLHPGHLVKSDKESISSNQEAVKSDQHSSAVTQEKIISESAEKNIITGLDKYKTEKIIPAGTAQLPAPAHLRSTTTRSKTKITIQPAELGNEDIVAVPGSNKFFVKNKQVVKHADEKINMQVTPAETGEEVASVTNKSIAKENIKDKIKPNELQEPAKELVASISTGSQKQNKNINTQHQPETAAVTGSRKVKKNKTRGLFADMSIMPFLPIRQNSATVGFTRSSGSNNSVSEFTGNNITSRLEPSVAFQLQLRKSISRKWNAGTGLQYSQVKQTVRLTGEETTTTYSTVSRLVTETGRSYLITDTLATVTKGTRQISAVNSYRFINVPLFVQYNAGKMLGFDFGITGGLFVNVYNHYSNLIEPAITANVNPADSKIGVDLYGALRLSKLYGRRIALFAEPTARFNISRLSIKNGLSCQPIHQIGIALGAAIKLK